VLKSGGPLMLVLAVAPAAGDKIAHVRWIDAEAQEHEDKISFSALTLIEENTLDHSRLLSALFGGESLNSIAASKSKANPAL
jgi:hypothetical protein